MDTLKSLYGSYNSIKFWVIASAISIGSAFMLPDVYRDISSSTDSGKTIGLALLFVTGSFGIMVLPFSMWQHIQRKKYFQWLQDNWGLLEKGALHPEGYIVNLDTKFVKYSAVFSIVIASVSFQSRPYAYHHRTAGRAQLLFTLLSLMFGWWYFGGLDGVVNTIKALDLNIRSKDEFSLRSLLDN